MTLESVAEINPESLDTRTPAAFQFRYIDIASVTSGVIDWSSVRTHRFATAPSRARRVVRPRDVLLSTVRPGLQAHAYADWSGQDGYVCSTGFAVLRGGRAIWPRFLYHLVFSDTVTSQVRRLEVGSNYPAITETDVRWLRIPQPPLSEQRRIAEILDTADRAIGETEALISKLKQMKTGVMHDLLTRGLDERGQLRDPDAHPEQFKDSPLGRIPREWKVAPLGSIAEMVTSGSRGWAKYYSNEGPKFLRIGNLTREHINLRLNDLMHVRPPANGEGSRTQVREGDLLISITADLGISGVIPEHFGEAYVNQHIALVRLNYGAANPRWVGIYLAGDKAQKLFYRHNDSGAKAGLNLPTISALPVSLPVSREQDRIAEILDAHDARIRAEEAYRDKLKLQRKGLMEDLLTGKVRVGV
jgi:type I restriction enzyme S subunit